MSVKRFCPENLRSLDIFSYTILFKPWDGCVGIVRTASTRLNHLSSPEHFWYTVWTSADLIYRFYKPKWIEFLPCRYNSVLNKVINYFLTFDPVLTVNLIQFLCTLLFSFFAAPYLLSWPVFVLNVWFHCIALWTVSLLVFKVLLKKVVCFVLMCNKTLTCLDWTK